jgi:rubrerythrin
MLKMEKFKDIDEILDFAMQAEQEAVDFYTRLAQGMKNAAMRQTFLLFAEEEVNHKARLQKIKEERLYEHTSEKVQDLQIADYVAGGKPSDNMTYSDALILAMKKEKAAFRLYTTLAERTSDAGLKAIFENLAMEESKHKLRFELEYDEYVLREN